jgi:hypothetical protein
MKRMKRKPMETEEDEGITEMKYNLSRPLLRAWLPKGSNKYGHVSLQTNKYYISFWPKEREGIKKKVDG